MIRHLLMLLGLPLGTAAVVQAQIPQIIPYQGVLYGDDGLPVNDGVYQVTFSLYPVGEDQPVWQEIREVMVEDGLFNVYLGQVVPLDLLPFDQPYELGVAVGGEEELQPRIPLGSVPYALFARRAEELSTDVVRSLNGSKGDLQLTAGQNVQITTAGSNITIDALLPGGSGEVPNPLELANDTASATITGRHTADKVGVRGVTKNGIGVQGLLQGNDGYAGAFANSDSSLLAKLVGPDAVLSGEINFNVAGMEEKIKTDLLGTDGGSYYGMRVKSLRENANGNFDVLREFELMKGKGIFRARDEQSLFEMEVHPNPLFGGGTFSLRWDYFDDDWDGEFVNGVQLLPREGAAGWFYLVNSGTSDDVSLAVLADTLYAFWGMVQSPESSAVEGVNDWNDRYGALGHKDDAGVFGANKANPEEASRVGYLGTSMEGVRGEARDPSDNSLLTEGRLGTEKNGIQGYGYCDDCIGVYGRSEEWTAIYGFVLSESARGVVGYNGITEAYAALAIGHTSVLALSDPTNPLARAGSFWGDVQVTGTLTKAGGSFQIDHPLDPANKYLYHSFVESPDMLNIYNGTVTLDEQGEAWVKLPEWFEALNKDYRYQLTPIGAPMPELHVAEEIADNRFKIAGGMAGKRVSWQVTGVRDDPWARAHRIPVEVDKEGEERGRYLHPELYGQPMEKGLVWPLVQERERLKAHANRLR